MTVCPKPENRYALMGIQISGPISGLAHRRVELKSNHAGEVVMGLYRIGIPADKPKNSGLVVKEQGGVLNISVPMPTAPEADNPSQDFFKLLFNALPYGGIEALQGVLADDTWKERLDGYLQGLVRAVFFRMGFPDGTCLRVTLEPLLPVLVHEYELEVKTEVREK